MNAFFLRASAPDLRVMGRQVAEEFERVVRQMDVAEAIRALCPSHQRAHRESQRAA